MIAPSFSFMRYPPTRLHSPAGRSLPASHANLSKCLSAHASATSTERIIAIRYPDTQVPLIKSACSDLAAAPSNLNTFRIIAVQRMRHLPGLFNQSPTSRRP